MDLIKSIIKVNPPFELIEHLVTISAGIIAIYGILSWKRQSTWNSKKQLVDEVLNLLFQCKRSIRQIRSPGGHPETKEWVNQINEPIFKLNAIKYLFAIKFGGNQAEVEEIENRLNEVDQIVAKIISAEQRNISIEKKYPELSMRTPVQLKQYADEREELDNTLYWNIDGDDKLENQLNAVIEIVKKYYKEVMA